MYDYYLSDPLHCCNHALLFYHPSLLYSSSTALAVRLFQSLRCLLAHSIDCPPASPPSLFSSHSANPLCGPASQLLYFNPTVPTLLHTLYHQSSQRSGVNIEGDRIIYMYIYMRTRRGPWRRQEWSKFYLSPAGRRTRGEAAWGERQRGRGKTRHVLQHACVLGIHRKLREVYAGQGGR